MIANSASDFRKEAEEYVRQAQLLPSGTRRNRFLDMAGSCIRLAEQTEWFIAPEQGEITAAFHKNTWSPITLWPQDPGAIPFVCSPTPESSILGEREPHVLSRSSVSETSR